jgi:hypothetical protein
MVKKKNVNFQRAKSKLQVITPRVPSPVREEQQIKEKDESHVVNEPVVGHVFPGQSGAFVVHNGPGGGAVRHRVAVGMPFGVGRRFDGFEPYAERRDKT